MSSRETGDQLLRDQGLEDHSSDDAGADLVARLEGVVNQNLSGIIPDDVANEVERQSARMSLGAGLGVGEASEYAMLKNLGLTSLQRIDTGFDQGSVLSKIHEERRQQDDRFLFGVVAAAHESERMEIMRYEIASANRRHAMSLINDLIISNSRTEIAGVQGNVDDWFDWEEDINDSVLSSDRVLGG